MPRFSFHKGCLLSDLIFFPLQKQEKKYNMTWVYRIFSLFKDNDTMVNLANALGKEGTSSFRFDFGGNGESEGSFAYGNYWREVDDLHAVMEHFRGASRAISAILGHSKGVQS
ncbi:hypothetical protein SADUNF_Sadunf18G0052300 [Salix dunnii]|uniref:Uncharacterized protein n=1 Tax=Salix dunnii TaxID=1413687 RepID=A0A835J2R9_9ROSI|nr:hypothetical protein SADUNF_Sadunf18G0052300 [Salix dunnii]